MFNSTPIILPEIRSYSPREYSSPLLCVRLPLSPHGALLPPSLPHCLRLYLTTFVSGLTASVSALTVSVSTSLSPYLPHCLRLCPHCLRLYPHCLRLYPHYLRLCLTVSVSALITSVSVLTTRTLVPKGRYAFGVTLTWCWDGCGTKVWRRDVLLLSYLKTTKVGG